MGNGIDQGVKVESRKIGILRLDEHHVGGVVPEVGKRLGGGKRKMGCQGILENLKG